MTNNTATTARIDHTNCTHTRDWAGRQACRIARRTAPAFTIVAARGSKVTHKAVGTPDARGYYTIDCGSGLNTVGTARSAMYRKISADAVTCKKCNAR